MRCSACGGTRVEGCIQHQPTCPCYLPVDMFTRHPDLTAAAPAWPDAMFGEHPDLVEIESAVGFWYPSTGGG